MEDEYNVVIDTLQKKLDEIEEMQRGCDKQRMVIGGGMGLMDCIRYEQMDELRKAIKREQALAHVNETPKNEHGSDDVLNKAGNLDMMRKAFQAIETVLTDAYHRHFAECCGRGQCECCGDFIEQWTEEDRKILDTLSPIQRQLSQALATKPAKLVRLTESELLKAFTTAEKRKLVWQVDRERYLRHARIVMDAMEKLNGE